MTKTVDLKNFLEENRLGEYFDRLQAEGYEIQDLLESGDESLLELMGGKKAHLERLKRGLANLSANDSPIGLSNKLLELAGELPMVLAVPALEFCDQNLTPVLRLWALCDFVELSARLAVIVGIAEHGGKPPEKLRAALSEKIERPTLGQWLHMARATAEQLPENPAFSGLTEFISHLDKELCPHDKSQDFKRSVLALRNRLAHGGGLNKTAARDILLAWEAYVARLAEIFAPWRDFQMVSSAADGTTRILQGAEPKSWAGEFQQNSPGAIHGIIGDRELNLWPLLTDSRDDEDMLSGIYSRRGEVRLEYTPFEGDLAVLESEVPESFLNLLRRDTAKASGTLQHQEFTAELQKEAARRIGREEEFSQLLHGIGDLPTGGLLWVGGVAGMGKSCLMASVTVELKQCPPVQTLILPYRFKAGGGRCSVGDFLGYAAERIEAWIGIDQERSSKIKEDASLQTRFMELLRCVKDGWDILVVADGLDELPAQSDTWLDDVIISSAKFGSSRVRWALAGRPERGIPEKLSKAEAVEVFPAGLPPMKADDVRSFFFERISRSKMRSRLIARDEEKDGAMVNPFLREVVRRSEGLPVYMNHVVGDLIANKITPDQEGQLPKGITAYHEELLRRCAVGDLQAVMTPLVAILALAHEPLGVPALASILRSAGRLDTDNTNLVEKALAGVASMIRRAATPEGTDGYTLYHTSLRQHVCTAESFRETIPQMGKAIAKMALEYKCSDRHEHAEKYLLRWGVRHLIEIGMLNEAEGLLLDLNYFFRMLGVGVGWVEILSYWESCGLDKAPNGYSEAIIELLTNSVSPQDALVDILNSFRILLYGSRELFLFHTGLLFASLLLRNEMRTEVVNDIFASMKKIPIADRDWSNWLDARCLAAVMASHGMRNNPLVNEIFRHASQNKTETFKTLLCDAISDVPSMMLERASIPTDITSEEALVKYWESVSEGDDYRAQDLMALTLKLRKVCGTKIPPFSSANVELFTRIKSQYPEVVIIVTIATLRDFPRAAEQMNLLLKKGVTVPYYYWNAKTIEKCASALFDAGLVEKSLSIARLTNSLTSSSYILICLDTQKHALAANELLINALRPAFSSWSEKSEFSEQSEENTFHILGKERLQAIRDANFTFDCEKPEAMSSFACEIVAGDAETARQAIEEAIEMVASNSRYACRTLVRILRDSAVCGFTNLTERALKRAIILCGESNNWFEQAEKWDDLLTTVPDVHEIIKTQEWSDFLKSIPSSAQATEDKRHTVREQDAQTMFNIAAALNKAGQINSARFFIKASPSLPQHIEPDLFGGVLLVDIENLIREEPASIRCADALISVARHFFAASNFLLGEEYLRNAVDQSKDLDAYWRSQFFLRVVALLCDYKLITQAEDYMTEITEDWLLLMAKSSILKAKKHKQIPERDLHILIDETTQIETPHNASIAFSAVSDCLTTIVNSSDIEKSIDTILKILQNKNLSEDIRFSVIERILGHREATLPVLKKIQLVSQQSGWSLGIQSIISKAIS